MGHCFPAEKYQVESFCFYHHPRASLEWNIISGNLYMGDKSQSFFLLVSVETLLTMEKNTEVQLCLFLPALFALGVTPLDLATFMPVLNRQHVTQGGAIQAAMPPHPSWPLLSLWSFQLWKSDDFGQTWIMIQEHVKSFSW